MQGVINNQGRRQGRLKVQIFKMMKMKLTPMETAANLSNKLEQNLQQRKQSQKGGPTQSSNSVHLKYASNEGPNLTRLHRAKLGAIGDDRNQHQRQIHPHSVKQRTAQFGGRDPMKRLLNHSAKRATDSAAMMRSNTDGVQIVTPNSGFSTEQIGMHRTGTVASNKSEERKKLTQMQIYNKMQQAKLLGRHSNKFPPQMPQLKKGSNALSSLLRYSSPKAAKAPQQQVDLAESEYASMSSGNNQIQVQLDRSTKIFREGLNDPKAPISPILSEGSQDSETENTPLAIKGNQMIYDPASNYEIVETQGLASSSNILIKDYTSMVSAKRQEKWHSPSQRAEKDQLALQNALISYPLPPVQQSVEQQRVPSPKKEEPMFSSDVRDASKAVKVHGTHINNQNLFFDTKQEDERGKMIITVPATKASKFGLPTSAQLEKEYRLVKLNDQELSKVMSDETKNELAQIRSIQQKKAETKQEVYFEDIMTFPFELNCHKERAERKRRNLDIGQRLQEDRANQLWEKREQQLQNQQKKNQTANLTQEEECGAIGHNFNYMNIDELKQHEMGILNLFEGDRGLTGYVSHNKLGPLNQNTLGSKSKKYVRLSQFEYETIFEKDPSFNEKRAFVDVFRRKWKEDKGFCSMFNKRSKFRKAKSAALKNRERQQQARQLLKNKRESQMILNHQEKIARKTQEMQQKEDQAREILAELKQMEESEETRLQRKALRRTEARTPPTGRVKSAFTLTRQLPQLQQSQQNQDSQLFPLKKTDSLEDIMQVLSNKTQAKIGSAISPRAKSAHALGAKYRINQRPGPPQMVSQQPRLESSQVRMRDPSSKAADHPYQSETDDIKLTGRQAQMHQPLQNHDPDYLSNFITQMYQSTTVQYAPQAKKIEVDGAVVQETGQNSDIENGPVLTKNPPRYREASDNQIIGTLDSVGNKETAQGADYEESRAGTMKQDEMRKTASDVQSGLVSNSQEQMQEILCSQESSSKAGGGAHHVRMNESDIRIITLPSKERVKVQDQKQYSKSPVMQDQRNALQIQSVLDQQLLSFQYSRDPKSAKTLPIRRQFLLGQQEGTIEEKEVLSQRNSQQTVPQSHISPNNSGGVKVGTTILMRGDKNVSVRSERKPVVTSGLISQGAKIQQSINHAHHMDGIQSNEVNVYDNGRNYSNQLLSKAKGRAPTADAQMFHSGDQTAMLDGNRQSQQFTDSKDSKLSEDINDESFMQPKNQRDESFDSKGTPSAGKHALSSAYVHGVIDQATISSKDKTFVLPPQIQSVKQSAKPKANNLIRTQASDAGPSHRRDKSSNRRELAKLRQPENTMMIQSNRAASTNRATKDNKVSNHDNFTAAEDNEATIGSRQQRITVNSSYGKRSDAFSRETGAGKHGQSKMATQSVPNNQSITIKNNRSFTNNIISNPQTKDAHLISTLNADGGVASSNEQVISDAGQEQAIQKEGTTPWQPTEQPPLDMYLQQVRPSVYNLPHNPMNHKSYKCNYIKSRVEKTRMDFIQAQSQAHNFKVEPTRINSAIRSRTGVAPGSQNIYISESQASKQQLTGSYSTHGLSSFGKDTLNRQRSQGGTNRAMSAVTRVNNAYLRNQKVVQLRKKEQQFCYFMQQQRQNEQLIKSLEKTAQTKGIQQGKLAAQAQQPSLAQPRSYKSRVMSQVRHHPQNDAPEGLMIAGTAGRKTFIKINHDIEIQGNMSDQHIDSRLLETSSPMNRRVIENAYRDFDKR